MTMRERGQNQILPECFDDDFDIFFNEPSFDLLENFIISLVYEK